MQRTWHISTSNEYIFSPIKKYLALVYLNDIVITSRNANQHIWHIRNVLFLIHEAGLTLNLINSSFLTERIVYHGHVIQPGKMEPADHTTYRNRDLKPPCNKTELRSFFGFRNVYRLFVLYLAQITASLNTKLTRSESRTLDSVAPKKHEKLATLQDKLLSAHSLALARSKGHLTLGTDACDKQICCVSMQGQPYGTKKPAQSFVQDAESSRK